METTKTPGYNTRLTIAFSTDKAGRRIATFWSTKALRTIRVSAKERRPVDRSRTGGSGMTPETFSRVWRNLDRKARQATAQRDQYVVRANAEGLSFREIGEALGVSHTMVGKIIRRAQR